MFVPDSVPPEPAWFLMKLAGGLGAAFVMSLLWTYAHWTYSKWDLNIEFATALIGAIHLFYGIVEGILLESKYFELMSAIAIIAASIIVTIIYAEEIIDYVSQEPDYLKR